MIPFQITPVNAETDWTSVTAVFNYFVNNSMAAYSDEHADDDFFAMKWQSTSDYPFSVVSFKILIEILIARHIAQPDAMTLTSFG